MVAAIITILSSMEEQGALQTMCLLQITPGESFSQNLFIPGTNFESCPRSLIMCRYSVSLRTRCRGHEGKRPVVKAACFLGQLLGQALVGEYGKKLGVVLQQSPSRQGLEEFLVKRGHPVQHSGDKRATV